MTVDRAKRRADAARRQRVACRRRRAGEVVVPVVIGPAVRGLLAVRTGPNASRAELGVAVCALLREIEGVPVGLPEPLSDGAARRFGLHVDTGPRLQKIGPREVCRG